MSEVDEIAVWIRRGTANAAGAIGMVEVCAARAEQLERVLADMGVRQVPVGGHALRELGEIDVGVVARPSACHALVMPHGSTVVMESLIRALHRAGASIADEDSTLPWFYESDDPIEHCALEAIRRCASPIAIETVLIHAERWRRASLTERRGAQDHLHALRDPPVVALYGRPNVGKSTLTNALAGRMVSIVADEPGTTRDHVGVLIDCAGVMVRWLDTAGILEDIVAEGIEEAVERAGGAAVLDADLIIYCADARHGGFTPDIPNWDGALLRCATRVDLGAVSGADVVTSARTGEGIQDLAREIRDHFLGARSPFPDRLWRFHPALPE